MDEAVAELAYAEGAVHGLILRRGIEPLAVVHHAGSRRHVEADAAGLEALQEHARASPGLAAIHGRRVVGPEGQAEARPGEGPLAALAHRIGRSCD